MARILLRHGFGYLLNQLGLEHLMPFHWGIFGHHKRRTPYTQAEHLRLAIEELGVTFIKLGQILSTRHDLLPPDIIAELAKLQDAVPPEPPKVVESVIFKELGSPSSAIFAEFHPQPLGSASIGQVHAARLVTGEEVVVKVQRPGLDQLIEEDLAILMDLARLAQTRTRWGDLYDLVGMAEEFANTLRGELNYIREGRNAELIQRNLADEPALQIPKIYWQYTTKRILTMERIDGIKISDLAALDAARIDRRKLAATGVRLVVKMMLEDGFYHADPHPGNFIIKPGEVIGLLDYGMVGRLDEQTRENFIYLILAAVDQNIDRVIDRLAALGIVGTTHQLDRLKRDLGHIVSLYWGLPLEQIDLMRILEEFLDAARRHQLYVPANLTLISKTLMMHGATASRLDPGFNLAEVLGPYAREVALRAYLPQYWGKRFVPAMLDFSQLMVTLPRRIDRLLGQVERGNVSLSMRVQETEHALDALNRMVNRLILGVTAGASVIAISLLLQAGAGFQTFFVWFLIVSLAGAVGLAAWLTLEILRRGHH